MSGGGGVSMVGHLVLLLINSSTLLGPVIAVGGALIAHIAAMTGIAGRLSFGCCGKGHLRSQTIGREDISQFIVDIILSWWRWSVWPWLHYARKKLLLEWL